ncbi:MAG TPA: DUF2309 domain-containing protein [Gemmataceae bacterium]|nr:DUF2309 domain-containing protein [Gemmataceae bacterium]
MPRLLHLRHVIEHAAHLLPAQGPITVFIHHNTLHALEDLPFTQAVKKAATVFGCQPYLTVDRYRQELRRGRIRVADLEAVLRENLGALSEEKVLWSCTRLELRLAMLQYRLRLGPTEELLWFVAETDALRRVRDDVSAAVRERLGAETRRWVMRDLRGRHEAGRGTDFQSVRLKDGFPIRPTGSADGLDALLERFGESRIEEWDEDTWEAFTLQALWRVCCDGVAGVPELALPPLLPVRHRDLLLLATGVDADLLVHDVLIRFCGAFLDQGVARWQLPRRDEGFYRAFCALYRAPGGPPDHWLRELTEQLGRLEDGHIGPLESIRESLDALGVNEAEWDDFLSATLLALRGWAGMVRFLQERGDRVVHPVPDGSVVEFLAIRLLLDRLALAQTARDALGFMGPLSTLRDELRQRIEPPRPLQVEQRAFLVFQLAQVLGWAPGELHRLDVGEWGTLVEEIEVFSAIKRRRMFHLAYERRFYTQALDALALHNRRNCGLRIADCGLEEPSANSQSAIRNPQSPRFQAIFCIDEREESIRRHIEELAPDAVTFGIAGFYFLDMYYRGAADAHFVPLCPAIMRPGHWVVEKAVESLEETHQRRARTRWALGKARHQLHVGTRTFALGALLSAAVGVLASIPLIARTLFPRLTARIRKAFGRIVLDPPPTELQLERSKATPGPEDGHVGYTLDEMTDVAERVLRDTGLISNFARLVLTFGHGSTSMNNPHESAHDCGACGGSRGGPNGRAIAQILNDPRVREQLQERGLVIPPETVFVGGMHNTSSEVFTFYDLDVLPESHREEFEAVRALIEQAGDRDAHERCRRFQSAPLTLSFTAARQHVEGRAEDLAQVRPEWGHATNAVTIVGRRCRTRGLFLDRRAFLNSYNPTQDDADGTILARILQAVVPVCAGISLEYYFSYVDNNGYGSGTKLPHNITSLVGVMDGAASDLRTGLPWQMVEIHEPVRQLFVIETTPEVLLKILERNPDIARLVRNEWVRLALLAPDAATIKVYRDGAFHDYHPQAEELPRAASSVDWYRGWRDHLEFAEIGSE